MQSAPGIPNSDNVSIENTLIGIEMPYEFKIIFPTNKTTMDTAILNQNNAKYSNTFPKYFFFDKRRNKRTKQPIAIPM